MKDNRNRPKKGNQPKNDQSKSQPPKGKNHFQDKSSRPHSNSRPTPEGSTNKGNPGTTDEVRLNKFIANSGICSRRDADKLIQEGQISVNGQVITELGYKVKRNDNVKLNNKRLIPEKPVYILLNKPKDYITTMDDPEDRRTVMDLVKNACKERIFPVGRLDRNTTGLLLLTNDGELADKLTHPSFKVKKVYQVLLDKPLDPDHFSEIRSGITLEDGPVKVDDLAIITPDRRVIGIEIHEGRNRVVRRIFEKFDYFVAGLDRTIYAGLTKKDLPRGKFRFLEPAEIRNLKYFMK